MPAVGQDNAAMIKPDGSLWAWGLNAQGQLGQGTTVTSNVPKFVDAGPFKKVSFGVDFMMALKTDGTIWGVGKNDKNQIADGTTVSTTKLKQIGTANDWVDVTCGYAYVVAQKSNGELWGWGDNGHGELGLSSTVFVYATPTLLPISNIKSFSVGYYHTMVVKNDGTLWGTGYNNVGQLGNGLTANLTAFTQIGTATDWVEVIAGGNNTALRKTGTNNWAVVGSNTYGNCGVGNITSPMHTQTYAWTNIKQIFVTYFNTFAVKNDGTLWMAGLPDYGAKGNGVTTGNQLTPLQIGIATNWLSVGASYQSYRAIDTSRNLWVWGANAGGVLGNGNPNIGTTGVALQTTLVQNQLVGKLAYDNEVVGTIPVYKFLIEDGADVKKAVITKAPILVSPNNMTASNVPSPFVVSADSEHAAGSMNPWKAFDGNDTTWWLSSTGAFPHWIQIDLGSAKTVTQYSRYYANNGNDTVTWDFQGSNDGVAWTTLDSQVNNIPAASAYTDYPIANPAPFRYYRWYATAVKDPVNVGTQCGFLGLKLFEKPVSWQVVGSAPCTQALLESQGTSDFYAVEDRLLKQLTSPNPKLRFTTDIPGVTSIKKTAISKPRVVFAKSDLSLVNIKSVNTVTLTSTSSGNGVVRVIVSVDGGATYKAWNGTAWVTVNHNDLAAVKASGMTSAVLNARIKADWATLVGAALGIRFAYYLEESGTVDVANTDTLAMNVDYQGTWDAMFQGVFTGAAAPQEFGFRVKNDTVLINTYINGDVKYDIVQL